MTSKARVLFVCTANAARSQLAQALMRHIDSEHFEAFSAGTTPRCLPSHPSRNS
ncbi:low molecular weight phosphotyrosine phosphatase family protein [Pseudomonas fluorescens]|uniref:Low molecular weight phosphotyrosine phosphatase family protein n=1 Tax=Pseudomonas fluorescens TaxID=294 RepID=A0A0N8NXK9_PSEFL|nr:low molecular weight phosphotyrosine phosphatase family protein [Pseudomonas fluorescens]